ncbi:hypothetical protein [Nocardioides zhouii]|uniref:Uncharacterized protein n=1 Tax=Nocardioides zhouii TaxID=1168729 RepID=A0A4Q2T9H3_9ACTN|nr:hypothetical protein [Nocardioides zhouii]RYC13870.1 hypothetical protein EUA94_04595 [Nocardioides zhouii]
MSYPTAAPQKTRRHLMVPGEMSTVPSRHSTEVVQRWVMSVLAVSIISHLAGGMVFAAYYTDSLPASSRIGLLVIAGVMGCLALAAGFAIHRRSPVTPWLVFGLVPSLVGGYFCFAR